MSRIAYTNIGSIKVTSLLDGELVEAVGEKVAGLLVGAVADLHLVHTHALEAAAGKRERGGRERDVWRE